MIRFHLKWWMDPNPFVQGTFIHSPEPNAFIFTDARRYGWGAHLESMRLFFHSRWTEVQSKLHTSILEKNGHSFCTKKATQYIHHSCVMISTDNTTMVSYFNNQGGTYSPNLCIEVWENLHWYLKHDVILRIRHVLGKFNNLEDRLSRLDKHLNTEWSFDQTVANCIFQMLRFPSVDLFATRFNHKLPLYVSPVPDNQAFAIQALSINWNNLHANVLLSTVLIPSILTEIRQSQCLIAPLCPQRPWFSEVLQLLSSSISPDSTSMLSKFTGKFQHQNHPTPSLHAWELTSNQ